jgi:hypothetical protein
MGSNDEMVMHQLEQEEDDASLSILSKQYQAWHEKV